MLQLISLRLRSRRWKTKQELLLLPTEPAASGFWMNFSLCSFPQSTT